MEEIGVKEPERLQDFITTAEIVKAARVHPGTVHNWRLVGKIVPVYKAGATYLYDRKKIMKLIRKRDKDRKKERKKHWE